MGTTTNTPETREAALQRLRDELGEAQINLATTRRATSEAEASAASIRVAARITPSPANDQAVVDAGALLTETMLMLGAAEDEVAVLQAAIETLEAELRASAPTRAQRYAAARTVLAARRDAMKQQLQALALDVAVLSRVEGRRDTSVGLTMELYVDLRRLNREIEARIDALAKEGLDVR